MIGRVHTVAEPMLSPWSIWSISKARGLRTLRCLFLQWTIFFCDSWQDSGSGPVNKKNPAQKNLLYCLDFDQRQRSLLLTYRMWNTRVWLPWMDNVHSFWNLATAVKYPMCTEMSILPYWNPQLLWSFQVWLVLLWSWAHCYLTLGTGGTLSQSPAHWRVPTTGKLAIGRKRWWTVAVNTLVNAWLTWSSNFLTPPAEWPTYVLRALSSVAATGLDRWCPLFLVQCGVAISFYCMQFIRCKNRDSLVMHCASQASALE